VKHARSPSVLHAIAQSVELAIAVTVIAAVTILANIASHTAAAEQSSQMVNS
jgi:hypothetical protein